MMIIHEATTRAEVARRLGEEILRIYERENCPLCPVVFTADSVIDDEGSAERYDKWTASLVGV